MLPGQEHMVATATDSIAFGAHFYNIDTMHLTLETLIIEHYSGVDITNAAHPKAHLLVIQWCMTMRDRLETNSDALG
jgi:hypothetical protein